MNSKGSSILLPFLMGAIVSELIQKLFGSMLNESPNKEGNNVHQFTIRVTRDAISGDISFDVIDMDVSFIKIQETEKSTTMARMYRMIELGLKDFKQKLHKQYIADQDRKLK